MANTVKTVWQSGRVVVNGWLAIPSGFSAEIIAQCGFDSVTVDLQHGVQDYQSMVQCFQAMDKFPVTPMVRVPWNEPGIIGKVLDGGAYGVICPMINTRKDAEAFVAACKYPPAGTRSVGPIRAGLYGELSTYLGSSNEETMCFPMIETKTAVENLDAILDVPGVAGVYIGPADLGLSYGLPPVLNRGEAEILQIYDKIVEKCGKLNRIAGIHAGDAADALNCIHMGFTLVSVANDVALMAMSAKASVTQIRKGSGGRA